MTVHLCALRRRVQYHRTVITAIDVARPRPLTRDAGLSLGDRACLALARRLDAPVLTADTAWQGVAHRVELHPIR